ncbi:MAG: ATP-binding cassette domain-containing protein [Lachnospiraceae bacterium]|nr:ATP-binding cassette domain-containing protein [Lachnospiraceae bacterium]
MKKQITIYAGVDKNGQKEPYDHITLKLGEVISIVGHTGSGKTMLISDIEQLSQKDSASGRMIMIDDEIPDYEDRFNPEKKQIAMITQNTKCVSDLGVEEFLRIHAASRNLSDETLIDRVIALANKFTGESVSKNAKVTELSGGQTRALLFADAILIGASPIILVDEIENAGINKTEILKYVKTDNKLVIFATHDPSIVLQTEKRILMKGGAISQVITHTEADKEALEVVLQADRTIKRLQEQIRNGEAINPKENGDSEV